MNVKSVLGVGIVTLDIINIVDHYPQEDEELRAISQVITRGGNTANTLAVLSQFGHECYWSGTIADDVNVETITELFSQQNINCQFAKKIIASKQPTSYITLNQSNGSRTIVHYRDLPELDFDHFKSIPLEKFDWVHFEARAVEETVTMIQRVKQENPNIYISIEIEKPRAGLEQLFDLADVYLYSKAYAKTLGYNDAKSFLQNQKSFSTKADLVCSWGEEGGFALLANGESIHAKAYPPKNIIDTIGAGDTFNAALIHGRLTEKSWEESLNYACQIAGKKCGQMGFDL